MQITKIIFTLLVISGSLFIWIFGLQNFLNVDLHERHQCLMSWMIPNYIKMPLKKHPHSYKYSLYLYREGYSYNTKLTGIPLLFVHGNGGSHKQVRSLGVALAEMKIPIDVFAVDFEEELSGLHGQLLWDQAEFVNYCIKQILKQYRGKHKSVIGVGHSMGGLVLRAAFMLKSYKNQSLDTIITLGAPHREHPVVIEQNLGQFYEFVNGFWKSKVSDRESGNGFSNCIQ